MTAVAVRVMATRETLWAVVTAVLPIVAADAELDVTEARERYGPVFEAMGLCTESEEDLAVITGAVETAKWVSISAELAGVDPQRFWSNYLARMQ